MHHFNFVFYYPDYDDNKERSSTERKEETCKRMVSTCTSFTTACLDSTSCVASNGSARRKVLVCGNDSDNASSAICTQLPLLASNIQPLAIYLLRSPLTPFPA
uniref:Uncharacterized protein n=1 Tax=Glossina pallidipes TaxID=7398 RepID=A0A1B0AJ26_GLOPL